MKKLFLLVPVPFALCLPLTAQSAWNAPGDTLSVIMHPILNIPDIVIPGE
ncbi:MAG: hypothetical protein PHO16_07025 [Candidatus Cloacimonetes bacterium]|nr:hypothetical protein [Candidatus Cloacimonadota bacterium]